MELKSTPKIIKFADISAKLHHHNDMGICHYSIRFDTDAGVTIVEDIPIEQICMVSDTANRYIRFPGSREILMNRIADIAKAYEKMYQSIGIGITHWEVRADDPE